MEFTGKSGRMKEFLDLGMEKLVACFIIQFIHAYLP